VLYHNYFTTDSIKTGDNAWWGLLKSRVVFAILGDLSTINLTHPKIYTLLAKHPWRAIA